jgi:hypothetical protein
MIDPLSRIPNAQKATSYDEEKSMRKKGENSVNRAGKSAIPPDKNNDFTLGVESQ